MTEPNVKDPEGYICEKQVFDLKEVSNVLQVNCYETTEEVCQLVKWISVIFWQNIPH